MRYPSSYVLLTADTEAEILQLQPHPSAVPNIHLADVHHPTNMPPGVCYLQGKGSVCRFTTGFSPTYC